MNYIVKKIIQFLFIFVLSLTLIYSCLYLIYTLWKNPSLTSSIIEFFRDLESVGFNTVFVGVVALVAAYWIFAIEKEGRKKERIKNQMKLIDGLIAEIDIISALQSYVYGKKDHTIGNLIWYEECLKDFKRINELDHEVNKINFDKYIAEFDASICKEIELKKLFRTLSYLNDKVFQINHYVENMKSNGSNFKDNNIIAKIEGEIEGKKDKSDLKKIKANIILESKDTLVNNALNVIREAKEMCYEMRKELEKQKQCLQNKCCYVRSKSCSCIDFYVPASP